MALPDDSHTVPERLQYWAKQHPNAEAFVFIDKDDMRTALTCKDIFHQAVQFANHLRNLGLKSGDIVCNLLPESPNGFIAFFGIIFAGCIVHTGKLHLKDGLFLFGNLNKMQCKALVLSSDVNEECHRVFSKHFDSDGGNKVLSKTLPNLSHVIYTQENRNYGFKWNTSTQYQDGNDFNNDAIWNDGDADALILTTSGTTGMSKLVVHSGRFFQRLGIFKEHEHEKSTSGSLNYKSLCWLSGLPLYYLVTGQKRVCIDQRNPPSSEQLIPFVYDIIIQEDCDEIVVTITEMLSLVAYMKSNTKAEKWSLKTCIVGGRPLLKAHIETILPTIETFYNIYGASEVSAVTHKKIEKNTEFEDFNVGIKLPGCEFVVKDRQVLPPGKTGNLYVKSPWIFKRYFGDEELTKQTIDEDGFCSINDIGYVNDRGDLIIFGRTQDVIMIGDDYFHPAWIESIIKTYTEVSDVMIVKVQNNQLQNELCACVVPQKGSSLNVKMMAEFCKKKFVSEDIAHSSSCPKYFIILEKIPLTRNDKPDRKSLEMYAAKQFGNILGLE